MTNTSVLPGAHKGLFAASTFLPGSPELFVPTPVHVLVDGRLQEAWYCLLACPVALEFARYRVPRDWFRPGLVHAHEGTFVRLFRCTPDRVYHRIDFVALFECVEGWEQETGFRPERTDDQLLASSGLYRLQEFS